MHTIIIKNCSQYEKFLSELSTLVKSNPEAESPKGKRLELLAMAIMFYENAHFPLEKPTAIEAIKFRMDQQDLKQKDLIQYIGSASKVSEVLSGNRQLSKQMIRNLSEGLKIPCLILLSINERK